MEKCVEWCGSTSSRGFGNRIFEGKMTGAHRAAYCEAHNVALDEIEGKVVLQQCGNRLCINPSHLRLGTLSEANRARRAIAARRAAQSKADRGKTPPTSPCIKREVKPYEKILGPVTLRSPLGNLYRFACQKDAAEMLGLDQSALSKLVRGKARIHKGWAMA